ncbi:hypothetical protein VTI74DRAFT_8335 [Chaetomium olivicolor]
MAGEPSMDLCELFAQTAEQYPYNLAVDHPDGCLTYRELDEASSVLASNLRDLGAGDGTPVLLVTAHGTFNVVAILAILKAGGFFVPIDRSTWSPDAIKYVFDTVDSQVAVNTTPEPFASPGERFCHVLHITQLRQAHVRSDGLQPLLRSTEPDRTACTIFTSGSTGRAKGVMISHRSLALYSKLSPANLDIQPGDRLLHLLSVAFDACACLLFSALLNGGTVVPAEADEVYDRSSSCTVMASTPSLLSHLPRPAAGEDNMMYAKMHTILLGGETPTSELLESWIEAGVRVLAAYGATETTSMGCIREVERDVLTGGIELALVGKPMALSQVWLLDGDLGIVEDDLIEGEIVIGGEGVAQGYYKDEARTTNAFIWWNGRRVYRTGDYGRWVRTRGDGHERVLEFRGRKDRTVKNRGFLVNLDRDVEDGLYHAGASLGVKSVRAAMTENGIVAVVSPSCVDTTALLVQARLSMSAYCIPYRVEAVDNFPLSPNGKAQLRNILDIIVAVDEAREGERTASSALETETAADTEVANEETEEKLGKLLLAATEVLRQPGEKPRRIRGEDRFLDVGGSSLLALKLVSALRRVNLSVSPRDFLACRKFSEIAQIASTTSPSPLTPENPATVSGVERMLADLCREARRALRLGADEDIDAGPLTSLQLELAIPTLADASKNVNQVKLAYKGVYASMMERAWRAAWRTEPVFRTEICLADYEEAVSESSMAVGLGSRLDFLAYRPSCGASETEKDAEDELTIILTVHHSLVDGCSLRLLLDRVERNAHGWSLAPSPSPVKANVGLINTQRSRDAEVRAFFASYLKDIAPVPNQNRTAAGTRHHRTTKTALFETSAGIDEVTAFAAKHCVSAACIYYTAWAMTISVLERSANVVVGAVFSNRAFLPSEHEEAVGLYMSTLPLVFRFGDADESVVARLQRTMNDLATVGEYAWARSDQVGLGRRLRNLLAMQLPLPDEHSRPPAVRAESLENSDFPLSMLVEANGGLRVLYHDSDFDSKTIRRAGEHFKHALSCLLREQRVEDCMRIGRLQEALFDQADRVRIKPVEGLTVKKALEEAMGRFSELTALEDCSGTTVLSYGELDRLTNIIANHVNQTLIQRGDAEDTTRTVAVYGDGTVGWVLALLGILRAGRTFVPLDPKCTSQAWEVPAMPGMTVLAVDNILSSSAELRNTAVLLDDWSSPDADLVVVFTSGTTGTPKGVPISNRGFLALQSNPEATMFAAPGRRIAQFMSPAFDYCNVEIFSALLHGATLVLRDPQDPLAHLARANTATITPSVLAILDLNRFPSLETIYATGEAVTTGLVNRFATRTLFYNAYGPAECSICTSFTRMILGDTVTIGTAIDTARMYVLDEEQRPSPDGTRGEIYLAGVQVLRSYVNSSKQTAERILPDPWHDGERMYRTGDYGMRGRDGRIVYLGRVDRQVKIRGFRVELSGVEQAMLSGPAEEGISQLSETLLPSWVPQVILPMAEFPRSVNGKADTRALEAAYASKVASHQSSGLPITSAAHKRNSSTSSTRSNMSSTRSNISTTSISSTNSNGRSYIQDELAAEWRRLLQLEQDTHIQDSDDFICLGEDLTELENQVWFQYQVATNPAAFNIATVVDLQGAVDLGRLVDSLNSALASDPVLRSNFSEGPCGPRRTLQVRRPFNLQNDELIRVHLVAPRETTDEVSLVQLVIVTTHVIADMGTLQNLLQLTSMEYAGSSTAQTANHQRPIHLDSDRWTKGPSLESQAFWKEYLNGHGYQARKPRLLPPFSSLLATFQGISRSFEFSGTLVASLNALIRRLGVTHHQLALATAALTLQWLSQKGGSEQNDIILGAPNSGRSSPAERQALGQFLDRLPVRVKLHADNDTTTTTTTILTRVRESARAALANAIPFSAILSALDYPHGALHHPLFECMVTFHTRSAGLAHWLQLPTPTPGGGGGVSATSKPLFVPGVAKFPLMLEWFELDADAGNDGNHWLLHVELQRLGTETDTQYVMDAVRDGLEVVLRAVADECSLMELGARLDELQLPALSGAVNGEQGAPDDEDEMVRCLGDTSTGTNIENLTRKFQISLGVSFFEVGADSAAALTLRHRLRENLGLDVSVRDVFIAQSPLQLAQHVFH